MPRFSDEIMETIRENMGLESDDITQDNKIEEMDADEAFERVLEYNGISGFSQEIKRWFTEFYLKPAAKEIKMKFLTLQHTPKPWKAHVFEPEENKWHFVTAGIQEMIKICITGRWDSASKADAILISAAPDLLEALVEYTERQEAECDPTGLPEYDQAMKAIIKATTIPGTIENN